MDLASIASFLLPTLLSMLFGEGKSRIGNEEKFFSSSKKLPLDSKINPWSSKMYGYGYRYPKAQRIAFYDDPDYRFRWVRAAIGNRAAAAKSPWLKFLRDNKYLEQVGNILRKAGAEYRAQYGVKPSTKKGAKQRITKLQRAIAALEDEDLLTSVASDLEDKYNAAYVTETIDRLKDEVEKLENLISWQPPAQPSAVKQTTTSQQPAKKAKGYGLMSGLGYGYFY